MGAFSFHPRKSITCGEGGMLTTNNNELNKIAEKSKPIREGIKIGERVVISAGQTIMKDLKSDTIFRGEY